MHVLLLLLLGSYNSPVSDGSSFIRKNQYQINTSYYGMLWYLTGMYVSHTMLISKRIHLYTVAFPVMISIINGRGIHTL